MEEILATAPLDTAKLSFEEFRKEILNDYRIANESREASLLGRREVLTGKAKFGIFGDGKELAQIAMAKVFKEGDFRSGYYRDQTFMLAAGLMTVRQFFAQLYAHASLEHEPMTGGRCMNGHFATKWVDENGNWLPQARMKNSSADISPTAGQMPRLLGLALASKFYRENKELKNYTDFSNNGNEVAFGTIGDASTSEGIFWETLNAASVLQVPMAVSVWDDGYGISVPKEFQTVKGSISQALKGFEKDENGPGLLIFKAKAWDYVELIETYQKGVAICRQEHIPVLFHIEECTQPQGHSTSGSHERYKSKKRLQWEEKYDCIRQFRQWIEKKGIATPDELNAIEKQAVEHVKQERRAAWEAFQAEIKAELNEVYNFLLELGLSDLANELRSIVDPLRRDVMSIARRALLTVRYVDSPAKTKLQQWILKQNELNYDRYSSHLYSESSKSALKVQPVLPVYTSDEMVDGRIILRDNFDKILEKEPRFIAFGEDVGGIGGVNQTFEGLQKKYGENRVFDTGIREATIAGQGIGMAMRGLRPYAEIQYLDYLLYAIQILSDDAATLSYRTKGQQKAPLIVSTRGHRLEGIWHSGSPMGMVINALRGMYVCVPRNMTQAAGMYNTLLASDDAALVIEPLNGYRLKERYPANIGEFRVPLGQPEILKAGNDVTIVTYGSTCRLVEEAAQKLEAIGISCEVIDVQTLLPFDVEHRIVQSLQKTNKILFVDEDAEGGATGFMLQQVLEKQGGFRFLDVAPKTLSGKDHRPAYASDGDYFSKPSVEDIVEAVYSLMHEIDPETFPALI
ncbi:MAG: thiamine pyrophosphate-dependent enzyme [Flavobacteriales bacterium]|nr:thiamine pyrophosphate-dependent enzyme [Flavobacteriales bacterium]